MKRSPHPPRPRHRCSRKVALLVDARLSVNSRIAYAKDISLFRRWGGTIPCSATKVAQYVAELSDSCAYATIKRRLSAIQHAHAALGVASPTNRPIVQHAMRGIARTIGTAQRRAQPLSKRLLARIARATPLSTSLDLRDRAILFLGFAGAFRRAELAAIMIPDIAFTARGMLITLHRSKTDQTQIGRKVAIPRTDSSVCAVAAVERLLRSLDDRSDALFRRVHRSGRWLKQQLSSAYISTLVKQRLRAIGVDAEKYSGHSLRAGLVTEAARAGVPTWKIRQQTGHKSAATLDRYIRDADVWSNNAAARVLQGRASRRAR